MSISTRTTIPGEPMGGSADSSGKTQLGPPPTRPGWSSAAGVYPASGGRCWRTTWVLPALLLFIGTVVMPGRAQTNVVGGVLAGDTEWSGTVVVQSPVEVPAGVTLRVAPGTMVRFGPGVGMRIEGRLLAEGTAEAPITLTRHESGTTWGRLLFVQAQDSVLRHCVIEYSNCEGDHKDYYDNDCNPDTPLPSRNYFQAVTAVACHLDIEDCVFQNLPDGSSGAEGDAIAIISDDPDTPGPASANIRRCQFLRIGQGVHTRYAYVLVEDCYFTGHHGDNDDVDLYGESDPPPVIRHNLFLNPGHDDMINPTRCSAIIEGNIVAGGDDHGIVLRDKCSPIVINNLIYDCRSGGIAVQNQCDALLINNTIVNCGRGVRFFDHTGRWGPPYCLNPGSGRAVLINCIIWDCPTTLSLSDSPYSGDRGSHATLIHCDVQGGTSRMSISANSTVNYDTLLDVNPKFVDAANGDFRLQPDSPCLDAGTNVANHVSHDLDGVPRPLDSDGDGQAGFDLGPYERLLPTADSNGDGVPDGWYARFGLNPADAAVGSQDPDNDGLSTKAEWVANTDPTNALSRLRIERIELGPPLRIWFQSSTNRLYTLYAAETLPNQPGPGASWKPVNSATGQLGNGEMQALTDTNALFDRRFYKLGVELSPGQ